MGQIKKFLYVFSGHRRQLIFLLAIFLVSAILEAFGIGMVGAFLNLASEPEIIRETPSLSAIYQHLSIRDNEQFILLAGIFIICVFVVKSLLFFLGKFYTFRTLLRQRAATQERLFNVYLTAPYEFHLNRNTSDFVNKIAVESFRFTNLFALPFVELFSHVIVVFTLVILMSATNEILFLFSLAILGPSILIFALLSKRLKRWGKQTTVLRQNTIKTVSHGLGGLKETRIIGCESYFRQELSESVHRQARLESLFQSSQFIPRTLIETLLVVTVIGFICLSQIFWGEDFQSVVSTMGVFALASFRLVPAASQLTQCLGKLRNTAHTLDTLYLDLKEVETNQSGYPSFEYAQSGKPIQNTSQNIPLAFEKILELRNVVYRYPRSQSLSLDGISIQIRRGESIGIIGKSGAGKTTLVDVLLALLKPESGDISVDGQSIYRNLQDWKQLVGYIPQSIFLLDDTVEHNIAYGVPSKQIDSNRLWHAIQAAQLEELVQELEEGVNTSIGERGVRLSGGQRQRIGIARALYHQREILVLDEATSALDNETELLISESIRSLAGSKTLIIIAHRLTTLEHCDLIYVLEKGRVLQAGKYQDVVLDQELKAT